MNDHPWRGHRVGVLLGGLSAERDVSLMSGGRMARALRQRGYDVVEIDPGREVATQVLEAEVAVVMVGLHGTYGEDGCLQGLLEVLGVPYTGSPPLASGLAFDKVLSKRIFIEQGLPTPEYRELAATPSAEDAEVTALGWPLVVKPAADGSSMGLTIVRAAEDLPAALAEARRFGDGRVLCERFVPGMETTVAVLDGEALGTVEIVPAEGEYDYEAKYFRDDTEYVAPARLPQDTLETLHDLAERTHGVLGCAGATRVDFIVDDEGRAWLLELNTLPGMTDHSLLPMGATLRGLSFEDLVEAILDRARCWHRVPATEEPCV